MGKSTRNRIDIFRVAKVMNWKIASALAAVSAALICGCSSESKQDYNQAGQNLKNAAQETSSAVKKDVQVAADATKNAVTAAKNTAENAREGKPTDK
jgi:hypothetical protein